MTIDPEERSIPSCSDPYFLQQQIADVSSPLKARVLKRTVVEEEGMQIDPNLLRSGCGFYDLGIDPVRSANCFLKAENILFTSVILNSTYWGLSFLKTPNLGKKSLTETQRCF